VCGSRWAEQNIAVSSHLHEKKSRASRFLQTAHRFLSLPGDDDSGDDDIDVESNDGSDGDIEGTDIDDNGSDAECRMDAPTTGMGIGIDIDGV